MSLEINSNISGSSYCGWTVNRNCSGYHSSNYFSIDVSPGSTNLCSCDLSLLQSQEVEGSSDQHQHQWYYSALPPGPVYEELTTEDKKRADQMEMKGNVAYGPSKKLPLEQNVAYGIVK